MKKISLTIDVNKIRKERIAERSYTTNQGEKVVLKEMKLDVIPLKEEKIIKSGDTWDMVKVGFVAETQTKEEQEKKEKSNIIGDAIQFRDKREMPNFDVDSKGRKITGSEDINPEDIPF